MSWRSASGLAQIVWGTLKLNKMESLGKSLSSYFWGHDNRRPLIITKGGRPCSTSPRNHLRDLKIFYVILFCFHKDQHIGCCPRSFISPPLRPICVLLFSMASSCYREAWLLLLFIVCKRQTLWFKGIWWSSVGLNFLQEEKREDFLFLLLLGSDLHWYSGRPGRLAQLGIAANGRLHFLPVRPAQSAVSMLDRETTAKGRCSCSVLQTRRECAEWHVYSSAHRNSVAMSVSLSDSVPSDPLLSYLLGNWTSSSNSLLLEKGEINQNHLGLLQG